MLVARGLALALALATGACSSSSDGDDSGGPPEVTSYDHTCATVADCALVYSGDPCGCSCDQAAIASSAREQYRADREAYQERACPQGPPDCGPCAMAPELVCSEAQCGVAP